MTRHVVRLEGATRRGEHFGAEADENLLAAAQRAHWLVRYGCRNGNCNACAATLIDGRVNQRNEILEATPDSPTTVLLCLCRAESDLLVGLPGDPLHGSRAQARTLYSRINSARSNAIGGDGAELSLHLTLPAGRSAPAYPGQYFLLEHHGELLRAEVDTRVSNGRDLHLQCITTHDFAAVRYINAVGPLGYCYSLAHSVLILRDTPLNTQARLLRDALPGARICDAGRIADGELANGDVAAQFDTVLACTTDPLQAGQWYGALLDSGVEFDEFRSDDDIRYRWRVLRQDDNGNRFALDGAFSEEAARELAEDYQRRGHKQLYWAEPIALRDRD